MDRDPVLDDEGPFFSRQRIGELPPPRRLAQVSGLRPVRPFVLAAGALVDGARRGGLVLRLLLRRR